MRRYDFIAICGFGHTGCEGLRKLIFVGISSANWIRSPASISTIALSFLYTDVDIEALLWWVYLSKREVRLVEYVPWLSQIEFYISELGDLLWLARNWVSLLAIYGSGWSCIAARKPRSHQVVFAAKSSLHVLLDMRPLILGRLWIVFKLHWYGSLLSRVYLWLHLWSHPWVVNKQAWLGSANRGWRANLLLQLSLCLLFVEVFARCVRVNEWF